MKDNSTNYLNLNQVTSFIRSTEIKLIVFDLHGTLTNRLSIHPYHIAYRNDYIQSKTGKSITLSDTLSTDEAFSQFPELNKYEYYRYRDNDPAFRFENIHSPNPALANLLYEVSDRFYTVLYTDSYQAQINRTLDALTIHRDTFNMTLSLEHGFHKSNSPMEAYVRICNIFQLDMKNILIIGDRMDKDITPVLNAGGSGICIPSSQHIIRALEILLSSFK